MNKTIRITLTALLFFAVCQPVAGQRIRFLGELDFATWFDNREYKSDNSIDQTLFGARITPIAGLGWGEGNSINIGGDFRAEFGSKSFSKKPEFIMYYHYDSWRFKAYAGVFPRRKVMGDYPAMFFSDSTRYYDTNLDGALFQYMGRKGYAELACDWLSMISGDQREKFVVFSSGRISPWGRERNFEVFAGYYVSMFHHSISENDDGVVDNLLAYPYVGFRYTNDIYRTTKRYRALTVKVGWAQAMQRDRKHEDKFRRPGGVQVETKFEWRSLGLENTLYLGRNLMPLYEKYGNGLYQADPLYRTTGDVYDRVHIFWNPVRRPDMNLKVGWVQVYDGKKWGSQQLVTFSVNLNKKSLNW